MRAHVVGEPLLCLRVVQLSVMRKAIDRLEKAALRYYMTRFLHQLRIDASARIIENLSARSKLKRMLIQCYRLIHLDRAAPMFRYVRVRVHDGVDGLYLSRVWCVCMLVYVGLGSDPRCLPL